MATILSATSDATSGGRATEVLRAAKINSATSNATSGGSASALPFYPIGALDDFGIGDYDQPDPIITRVWNYIGAVDSATWQRVWLATFQPKDYYDGSGNLVWAHGAYAAVGFKWVGVTPNAIKYYDKVQFEHTAGAGNVLTNTLSPGSWESARVINIALHADRVNENPTPSFEVGQGTWAPFNAPGQAAPRVTIDPAVSRYAGQSLRLDIPAMSINRVTNSSFDTDVTGWAAWGSIAGTPSISRSTDQQHSGSGSLAVSNLLTNAETTIGTHATLSTAVPALQMMTVNAWVWPVLDPTQSQYVMQLRLYDATHLTFIASQSYTPPGGQWSLLTMHVMVPANSNAEAVYIDASGYGLMNSAVNQVMFYVDDVGVFSDNDTLGQGIAMPEVLLRAGESYTTSVSVRLSDPTVSVSVGITPGRTGAHVYESSPPTTGRANLDGTISFPQLEGSWYRIWAKVLNSGYDNTTDTFTVYTNPDPVTGNVPAFTMWLDGALIERSSRLLDYFDGSFLGVDYLWEGAQFTSRSHYYEGRREKQYRIDDVIQSAIPMGANYVVLYAQPDNYQASSGTGGGGSGGNSDGTYLTGYGVGY